MHPREFAPGKQREHASWRCELPRVTPNSSKPARTGLSMTAPNYFWIPRRLANSSCSSAVEQNSPGRRRNPYKQVESRLCLTAKNEFIPRDRKSTRLNSSHGYISYAVFCLKKKKKKKNAFNF